MGEMADRWQIIGLIIIMMSALMLTYVHEETHKTIFGYYGVDSDISYRIIGRSSTSPNSTDMDYLWDNHREGYWNLKQSHDIVDAVSYPLTTAVLLIMFMIVFFGASLIESIEDSNLVVLL